MICEICGREFNKLISLQRHFSQTHNISSNKYYNKYLKRKDEGICYCGRKTKYKNISLGYHKFCSTKCQSNDAEVLTKRTKKTRGDNHWTRRTGKGPNKDKTYEEIHGLEKAQKLKEHLSKQFLKNCVGEGNPFYGRKHNPESREKIGAAKRWKTYEQMYGEKRGKELRLKKSKKNKPQYTTFNYHNNFYDLNLRTRILQEQLNKCPICFEALLPYRKNLHHINYVKRDNRRRNLIYLCVSCHSTTNGKRSFWKSYLKKVNRIITKNKKLKRKYINQLEKELMLENRELIINRRIR